MILRILRAIRALLEPRHLCPECSGVFRESHMMLLDGRLLCVNDFIRSMFRGATAAPWVPRRERDEYRWQ